MGSFTKIQRIKRAKGEQYYISFPYAIARALELKPGEVVEWLIEDKQRMVIRRSEPVLSSEEKKTGPIHP